VAVAAPALESARATLERARAHLLEQQHPDGWWKGELETNVTIDAEDLFLHYYLGILDPKDAESSARWIRSRQREDGSWATFYGGPPDLSTTVEAYLALKLAGDAPEAAHMRRAAVLIRAAGGVERSRVFTRMWLSLLGLWSWADVPMLPPEQIMLPARALFSVYTFGCWARQTIVALSIVSALRPQAAPPFAIDELRTGASSAPSVNDVWDRLFVQLDRGLHLYERRPIGALRRRALARAERWMLDRQEKDGSWGGIQPPWVWSIVALHALGRPLDDPALAKGLSGLDVFTIEDEQGRRIEACQSPVWDTGLAVLALLDAGLPAIDPRMESAAVRRSTSASRSSTTSTSLPRPRAAAPSS
jgi:squalene-hopene/tetraprenyl-beta-curcumene cyclase